MNRQDLQNKLNELLVGKSAYNFYKLTELVREHFSDLEIDNSQGEYGTRINAYTITITYKDRGLVSFEVKRRADTHYVWCVKSVIIKDENFVDYETNIKKIKERLKKEANDEWRYSFHGNDLATLKHALRVFRACGNAMTKREVYDLIRDLEANYWVVDEALESEEEHE